MSHPETAAPPLSVGRRATHRRAPARVPLHVLSAIAVSSGILGLLVFTAAPTLSRARPLDVVPAVFDRSASAPPGDLARQAERQAARPGKTVQAPGWLEADPFRVACTALTDGIIDEVLVLEGEAVERGQPVATLIADDARLDLARSEAELGAAKAGLVAASAEVHAANTDWENPVERDRSVAVAKAALAETEAELAQLPALIDSQTATLERLREEHNRLLRAAESGAATTIELVIADKLAAAQEASLEALRRSEPILESQRDRLRAELAAAERAADLRVTERRALDLANSGLAMARAQVELATARRDVAQLRFDRTTIIAPISGLVQRRLKEPGDKVMMAMDDKHSAHVLHLYNPAKLQVRVDVPLADAASLFVGQRCEVTVEVLPDQTFEGEVTRVTNEADLQKNTLQIKVRVIDPSPVLKPEMLTRVKFLASPASGSGAPNAPSPTTDRSALVPESSMLFDGERAQVWVVRERRAGVGVVVPLAVEVRGDPSDGWVRVTGDLHPGDLLAASPDGLRAGERVSTRRAGGAS